ncbi:MAG TPA: type 4a pilus biogenesis protein PilO [Opitutaceae bacterium]|nr:type 4a pilus biogenesis protein PilO [Opitutaceae bacterium]
MITPVGPLRGFARRRPLVAGCLFLAALSLPANLYLWRERSAVTAEHAEIRRRGEATLAAVADRGRIKADVAALTEALGEIDRHLASEESMEVNLGYFYRVEKLSRVRLARIDQLVAAPTIAGQPYKAVPVSLRVTGPYRNLLAFIRELETGPRLLRVREYRLERDPGVTDLNLHLTVDLLAHP